jgi:type IV pilus assembly protein PilB
VQSALTGHLVFTTVHANNVVDVLGRFLNMKVELYNFVSGPELRPRATSRPEDLRPLPRDREVTPEGAARGGARSRKPCATRLFTRGLVASSARGSGFHGRVAIAELLDLSDRIRGLILDRRPAADIRGRRGRRG